MIDEPGSPDCRLVIDAKRSLEEVLRIIDGLPHTDHIRRQLLSVYNQLEGMHDLKRAGGSGCPFVLLIGAPRPDMSSRASDFNRFQRLTNRIAPAFLIRLCIHQLGSLNGMLSLPLNKPLAGLYR